MGRRTHSSLFEVLPEDTLEELNRRLASGETYRDASSWLSSQGYEVGKSTICRYWLAHGRELADILRMSRAVGTQLTEGGDRPATELHEAANYLLLDQCTRMMLELERDDAQTIESLEKLTRMLTALQRSAVYTERVKASQVKAYDRAAETLSDEFHRQLQDAHPELLERLLAVLAEGRQELSG